MPTLDKKRKREVKDVGLRKSPDIFDYVDGENKITNTSTGIQDSGEDDTSDESDAATVEDSESDNSTDKDDPEFEHDDEELSEPDIEEEMSSVTDPATQKYHEGQEAYPEWPIYDIDISDVRNGCSQVSSTILKKLSKLKCREDEAREQFIQKAEKSTVQTVPEPVVIGLLGETGAGKSETLNSILDQPGLAKAVSAGTACTAVVTEFMHGPPEQQQPYAAKVHYFDRDDRKKMLNEQIKDCFYYLYVKARKGKPAKDPEAETVWKPRYETAIKIFRALFCDHKEFRTRQKAIAHLAKRKSKSGVAMLNEAMKWCDATLESREPGSSCDDEPLVESYHSKSVAALHKILDPLITSTTGRRSPSLWPIVSRVTIACKNSRVLESAVVVDLPGVADTNKVRVRAAEDYLMHCDHLLLVGHIDRICDNATIATLLQRYGDQFRGRIAIIATRAGVDPGNIASLTEHYAEQGYNMKEYKPLQRELIVTTRQLSQVKRQLIQIPAGREADVLGAAAALDSQIIALTRTIEANESKRLHFIVKLRNAIVTQQLRQGKQNYCYPGDKMRIFCISNTHYAAVKGRLTIHGAILHPDATGIPALRKHLLTLNAPHMMAAFNRYVDSGVATLTQGLMIWAAAREVEDADQIRRVVHQPRSGYLNFVDEEMAKITDVARIKISDPLKNLKIQAVYCKAALGVVEPWKTSLWHWCTVKAFVRNAGFAGPKSVKAGINWNTELSRIAVEQSIIPSWRVVNFECKTLFARLSGSLFSKLRDVVVRLDQEPEAQDLPLHTFEGFIDLRIKDLEHAILKCRANFAKKHSEILSLATRDKSDNYFVRAMRPVYTACELEKGRGVKGRIIEKILKHVIQKGTSSPFAMLGSTMEAEVSANSRHCAARIKEEVDRVVGSIEQIFESMVLSRAQQDVDLEARAKVKAFLEKERILESVAELRAKRDAIMAKPEYAHVPTKCEDFLNQ